VGGLEEGLSTDRSEYFSRRPRMSGKPFPLSNNYANILFRKAILTRERMTNIILLLRKEELLQKVLQSSAMLLHS
jgi:hypothetical protein